MDHLVRESRACIEAGQVLPARGRLADLLTKLALGRLEHLAAVQLARRQLQQALLADRLAGLAHEPDPLAVVRQHHHGTRVLHNLSLDNLAVIVAEPLDLHGPDVAFPDLLLPDGLEAQLAPPFARAAPTESPAGTKKRYSAAERP